MEKEKQLHTRSAERNMWRKFQKMRRARTVNYMKTYNLEVGISIEHDIVTETYKLNWIDLLAPITHPSQVPAHPAISRAFTNKNLNVLSTRALDIINEEHKNAVQFARLMSVFLGDDTEFFRANTASLPLYDHLNQLNDPSAPSAEAKETNGNGKSVSVKAEASSVTRKNDDMDPFFAPPRLLVDRLDGVKPDDIEASRQLTQIAQQRCEEYIRCMTKVRYGLLKAERYQNQVFRWCQEMAGIEDNSDGMEQLNEVSPERSRSTSAENSEEVSTKK